MTFTLKQACIALAIPLALGPAALAVMPPYTSTSPQNATAKEDDKSQAVSNQEVLWELTENKRMLQEVLQRLDTLQISSAPLKTTR